MKIHKYWNIVNNNWDDLKKIMSDFLTSEELSKACELHSARDRDVCEYIKLAWHRIMDSEIEYVPNFSILDKLYENSHILYE